MLKGAGIFAAGTVFGAVVGGVAGLVVGASLAVNVWKLDRIVTPDGVRFEFKTERS